MTFKEVQYFASHCVYLALYGEVYMIFFGKKKRLSGRHIKKYFTLHQCRVLLVCLIFFFLLKLTAGKF